MKQIIFFLFALMVIGCGSNNAESNEIISKTQGKNADPNCQRTLSLFGVSMEGADKDVIIRNLIVQTKEFEYCDSKRTAIKRVLFCEIPCGLNIESEEDNGLIVIHSIVLLSSLQDKSAFNAIKNGLTNRFGKPDIEKYEAGEDELDGIYYGRCQWNNGAVTLRNVHCDEGGLLCTLESTIEKPMPQGQVTDI